MSILTKTDLKNASAIDCAPQGGLATTEQARSSYRMKSIRRDDEPLEEAFEDSEPPESRARPHGEAPDAGAGHFYHDDREFRHGRSRG
jgi:hypothetical protein